MINYFSAYCLRNNQRTPPPDSHPDITPRP
jgi:hypothetical protein